MGPAKGVPAAALGLPGLSRGFWGRKALRAAGGGGDRFSSWLKEDPGKKLCHACAQRGHRTAHKFFVISCFSQEVLLSVVPGGPVSSSSSSMAAQTKYMFRIDSRTFFVRRAEKRWEVSGRELLGALHPALCKGPCIAAKLTEVCWSLQFGNITLGTGNPPKPGFFLYFVSKQENKLWQDKQFYQLKSVRPR